MPAQRRHENRPPAEEDAQGAIAEAKNEIEASRDAETEGSAAEHVGLADAAVGRAEEAVAQMDEPDQHRVTRWHTDGPGSPLDGECACGWAMLGDQPAVEQSFQAHVG